MNEHELFQKTFSNLHASDTTLQEVMSRAHSGKSAKGVSKRFAVLVAVVVVFFSMAIAVHAGGMLVDLVATLKPAEDPAQVIDDAFGDKISTEKPKMEDAYGNEIEAPVMERPEIDLTETEALIGAYISDVDGVLTSGENKFTLKNFMIDETGSGALTWTVENPGGIRYGDAGYGMVYFNSWTIDNPRMYHYDADGNKKDVVDLSTALISKNDAGTKLELVSYFGTVAKYDVGDSFVWTVSRNRKQDTKKMQLTPVEHIPATTFKTADGMRLTIANHGLTIDVNSDTDFITDKMVIYFKDGTQYCVEDEEKNIYNMSGSFWRNTRDHRYDDMVVLFNRLIDTKAVSRVEVTGGFVGYALVGEYYEPVRDSETIIFYP